AVGSANWPVSSSMSKLVSGNVCQMSKTSVVTWSAIRYRSALGASPGYPIFSASASYAEVTMFQAARPPDNWCRVAMRRAISYGGKNDVEMVHPRRIRDVTAVTADITDTGSR